MKNAGLAGAIALCGIGLMMIGGLLIGCITCWVGQLYAQWAIRRWPLPIRDSGGVTLKAAATKAALRLQ
mgnify:CR=1 FL=1